MHKVANVYMTTSSYIPYGRKFWREDSFGGLLKICHLAEFTLAVEPVLSHNDIHNKMANRTRWEFNWA